MPVIIEYDDLKKLQLNAVTDPLTGLYNRRLFTETFERELNRAKRYSLPLGLVIMDMHRFKEVNDKHGHPRGDEVLRVAASTLKKALRTSDFAFRIGGDEFALVLPQTDAPQALALSRRIETVFAESMTALQLSVIVGMDHGVANYPQDADNLRRPHSHRRRAPVSAQAFSSRAERRRHCRVTEPAATPQPPVTPSASGQRLPARSASAPAPSARFPSRPKRAPRKGRNKPPVSAPSRRAGNFLQAIAHCSRLSAPSPFRAKPNAFP